MPCYALENGGIVCGDLGEHCADCGCVADYLCDYPVGDGKTCDRKLCAEHAHKVGTDMHYCDTHKAQWDKFKDEHSANVLEAIRVLLERDDCEREG